MGIRVVGWPGVLTRREEAGHVEIVEFGVGRVFLAVDPGCKYDLMKKGNDWR